MYNSAFLPPVSLIVAAYNEEDFILEKIKNTLSLDYPEEKLDIIFVTDGSTDQTPFVVRQFPEIKLLHAADRSGKIAAMHRAMSIVKTPYIIFSDANTLLNKGCIKKIVRHYQNPEVGGVAGEKKILQSKDQTVATAGEGLYWKYESFLKRLDSDFNTVVGAAGELFSIRTELYEFPGNGVLLDDFVMSLTVCKKGYRVAYEPEAYALESASISIEEEKKRKIRISAGAFQSMVLLAGLLNIFQYPKLSFQYISHRVLRWTLCPLFLPIIFVCNIILVFFHNSLFFSTLLVVQAIFYFLALFTILISSEKKRIGFLYIPYYFTFMNYSVYAGFVRFLKKRQTVLWEKAVRKNINKNSIPNIEKS